MMNPLSRGTVTFPVTLVLLLGESQFGAPMPVEPLNVGGFTLTATHNMQSAHFSHGIEPHNPPLQHGNTRIDGTHHVTQIANHLDQQHFHFERIMHNPRPLGGVKSSTATVGDQSIMEMKDRLHTRNAHTVAIAYPRHHAIAHSILPDQHRIDTNLPNTRRITHRIEIHPRPPSRQPPSSSSSSGTDRSNSLSSTGSRGSRSSSGGGSGEHGQRSRSRSPSDGPRSGASQSPQGAPQLLGNTRSGPQLQSPSPESHHVRASSPAPPGHAPGPTAQATTVGLSSPSSAVGSPRGLATVPTQPFHPRREGTPDSGDHVVPDMKRQRAYRRRR